jgi:hypothetical protein
MAAQAFFVLRLPSGAIGGVGFGRLAEKLVFHFLVDVVQSQQNCKLIVQSNSSFAFLLQEGDFIPLHDNPGARKRPSKFDLLLRDQHGQAHAVALSVDKRE